MTTRPTPNRPRRAASSGGSWDDLLRRLAREACPDPLFDEPPTGPIGSLGTTGSRPIRRNLTELLFDAELRRLRESDEPLRLGAAEADPAPTEPAPAPEPSVPPDDPAPDPARDDEPVAPLGALQPPDDGETIEPDDLSASATFDPHSVPEESSELDEWSREMIEGAAAILDAAGEATGFRSGDPKTGNRKTGDFEDVDPPEEEDADEPVESADVFDKIERLEQVGRRGRRRRRRRGVGESAERRLFPPVAPLVRLLLGRHDWDDVRPWRWWARTIFEIALVYLVIVIAESMFGRPIGGFKVHPHPYWIAIIPIAASRGAIAGMIASAVGTALYTSAAIRILETGDPRVLLDPEHMLEPILFFAVAFVVGDFRDVAESRRRRTARDLDDTRTEASALRHERSVLSETNRVFERRLVDQASQFGSLLAAARRIEDAERDDAFRLVLDLVEAHCGAMASILAPLEDGSLDVLCHRGWGDAEIPERLAAARASEFVERALIDGVHVSAFERGVEAPASGPLAVAPLFGPRGVVRALLCLDFVPAYRLNPSTISSFFGIAEWTSAALARFERADRRGGAAGAANDDAPLTFAVGPEGELWLGDVDELGERLRLDYERATRYGVPTSLVLIQAVEWNELDPDALRQLDRFVLTHFTGGLRPSDGLYRFGYPGCWVLVLTGTAVDGAGVVRERLVRLVEAAREHGDVGAFEVSVTAPDAGAPDLPSLLARMTKQFRRRSALHLDAEGPVVIPDRLRAGDVEDFLRRLRVEIALALRSGLELHVLGIFPEKRSADAAMGVARHVVEIADDSLRRSDGVYAIGSFGAAIVLPGTGDEAARRLGERVLECVAARDPDAPFGEIVLTTLAYGPRHPDPVSFLNALADPSRIGTAARSAESVELPTGNATAELGEALLDRSQPLGPDLEGDA